MRTKKFSKEFWCRCTSSLKAASEPDAASCIKATSTATAWDGAPFPANTGVVRSSSGSNSARLTIATTDILPAKNRSRPGLRAEIWRNPVLSSK